MNEKSGKNETKSKKDVNDLRRKIVGYGRVELSNGACAENKT